MDRIPDSGSDDWGSTPHGCTIYRNDMPIPAYRFVFIIGYITEAFTVFITKQKVASTLGCNLCLLYIYYCIRLISRYRRDA